MPLASVSLETQASRGVRGEGTPMMRLVVSARMRSSCEMPSSADALAADVSQPVLKTEAGSVLRVSIASNLSCAEGPRVIAGS